ncbi:MAG: beta strand repeat-containing protein, partial [Acidobacteriota bacterium]
ANASSFTAVSALAAFDSLEVGGGYGSTGVTVSNAGTIQANGNLTIDGTSTLTGNVTTAGDVAVNGGDLTTSTTTASLFNTTATTLAIGGEATTVTLGAGTGTTTLNNNLAATIRDNSTNALDIQQGTNNYLNINTINGSENISFGNATTNPSFSFLGSGETTFAGAVTANDALTAEATFTANGASTFTPSDTNDVTINTDSDSSLIVTGITSGTGTTLCLDGSDALVTCAGQNVTLQNSYDGGNDLTTTDARDISFNLADTTTDANFAVNLAADNTVSISREDGSSSEAPDQLLLLENLDTNLTIADGLLVTVASGGVISDGLDVSDSDIVNAVNVGANTILGTTATIDFSNFDLAGNGNLTTAGDVAINGGDLTTNQTTFNLINGTATTLNIGGAATALNLGANSGTATINNTTVDFAHATSFTADSALASFDALQVGGGYGSTGATISNTGNIQANGNLTIDGSSTLTGNVTTAGDVAVNGGDLTTTAATGNLFNTNATTVNIGGAATALSLGAGTGTTTINNNAAVTGTTTLTGTLTTNGNTVLGDTSSDALGVNATTTFNNGVTFSPASTADITFTTDSNSTIVFNGLTDTAGTALCIDGSNNLVTCSGNAVTLQNAYDGGNTIATTNNSDLAFT